MQLNCFRTIGSDKNLESAPFEVLSTRTCMFSCRILIVFVALSCVALVAELKTTTTEVHPEVRKGEIAIERTCMHIVEP